MTYKEVNENKLNGSKIAGGNPLRGRVKDDYYATNPDSVKALLKVEEIIYPALEPACGEGHISKLLNMEAVCNSDIIERQKGLSIIKDFLDDSTDYKINNWLCNFANGAEFETVITNPPFNLFQEFVEKSLKIAKTKVIMFGKLQALEGKKRATFLQQTPLKYVYVFKSRQQPLRNGSYIDEITGKKMASSTMAFAWFVWEIGYVGEPIIRWI